MAARVQKAIHDRKFGRQGAIYLSLTLAAVVFAIYFQVWHFEFTGYDDPEFILNNPHIRNGLTPASIAWAFTTGYAANWFPLTWLSYMLGVNLYGLSPGWHHLTNVFLHATNSILLFVVLRRMTGALSRLPLADARGSETNAPNRTSTPTARSGAIPKPLANARGSEQSRDREGAVLTSCAIVALLFAVHPLHVEAVAWVSERRELLSGLFWLLSMWAYADYVKRPRAAAYLLLMLAFACGLMSKPMIVTLPFALLLLDYWPLGRWQTTAPGRLILEKAPLAALSAASAAITLIVQQGGGAVSSLSEVPFHFRLENAVVSYLAYLCQFFWPAKLAVLYPYASDLAAWQVVGAAAILAAITALAIIQRRRRPYLFTGWFWFAGILIPVIGLVQVGVQSRADRYMYIPLIGLSIMVVWGVEDLASRRAGLRRVAVVLPAVACCALGVVAWIATAYWRDTVTLFRHSVAVTRDNWAGLGVLSEALLAQNRADEAQPYIETMIRLRPNLPDARISLGAALSKRGDFDDAAAQYRLALKLNPGNADALEGLGVVLTAAGRFEEALPNLQAAVKSRPGDPDIHYNLGRLYGLGGRHDLAAMEFTETVRLQPDNSSAHFNLGTAYAAEEHFEEAAAQFREALRLKPDYRAANFNLAGSLASQGSYDEAIAHFQEVMRAQPDFPGVVEAIEHCLELKKQSAR